MQLARGKSMRRYVAAKRRAPRDCVFVSGFPSSGPPASTRACTSPIETDSRAALARARGSTSTLLAMFDRTSVLTSFPDFSDEVDVVATGEGSLMADTETEERGDDSCFVGEEGLEENTQKSDGLRANTRHRGTYRARGSVASSFVDPLRPETLTSEQAELWLAKYLPPAASP